MSLQNLNAEDTKRQSNAAYKQWAETWRKHARHARQINEKRGNNSILDLALMGHNRAAVLVALGQSLEEHIDTIKKYQTKDGVDVVCCDKAFKVLMERDIKPRIVYVADAVVSYEMWCEPFIEQSEDIILIASVTANEKWSENWKGPVYFIVNKDNVGTDKEMMKLSGITDLLPASAIVGNAVIVASTQLLGYSKQFMVGYDYSWQPEKNYYAFSGDHDGIVGDKRVWQKNDICIGINGSITFMSENLTFAARWLKNFYLAKVQSLPIEIYNASGSGIIEDIPQADLSEMLELFEYKKLTDADVSKVRAARARTIRCSDSKEMQKYFENLVYYAEIFYTPKEIDPWKKNTL